MSTRIAIGPAPRIVWLFLFALACAGRALAQETFPGPGAGVGAGVVDLELVLAVDASGSVDDTEFNLQMVGLARAFRDPAIHRALTSAAPNGVAITLFLWSDGEEIAQAIPWRLLHGAVEAIDFADRIDRVGRTVRRGGTAIGTVVVHAIQALENNAFRGARRIIDVSGDGWSNRGIGPEEAREVASRLGITINGLAILNEYPDLDSYYHRRVIVGTDSFVLTASDYEDFARAMKLKLLSEITRAPLS